ncbi:MAG TPA: polyprenyl synthetase family protein [Haliangiales bacterium]|nr:polyprenyl synthetase family protein [Haliangiales bacterium]
MTLPDLLDEARALVDAELARRLAGDADDPGRLWEAMRYAVLGGGKRLRPALVLAAARAAGGTWEGALPAAAAVELLHAYTLVHDDLPAMDDDDERRGRPTVHVAFGEGTAILVGDALLTEAFAALAALGPRCAEAVAVLADRAGARWLLAGQARDLAGGATSLAELERMHAGKTGALFSAAAELGAIAAGAGADARARLRRYGMALGIAFQHADDLADGDHPRFAAEARRRLGELAADARAEIAPLGDPARPLAALIDWVAASAA